MMKEKIIFITGASSGIGEACARYFAREGGTLVLCSRRKDVLQTLAKELYDNYGTKSHVMPCDVCKPDDVLHAFAALPESFKKVDILINNAGMALGLDTIQNGKTEDWDATIDTNVKGLLYITKAILPGMVERNSGHVINLGSIAGHAAYTKGVVYCATKAAVRTLSQGLRLDLFGTKVRVSSVDPGAVETNFSTVRFGGDVKRAAEVYAGFEPLTPNDIADAVLYCATRPLHVNVSEIVIMPTDQTSPTNISRHSENKIP